ncbi:sna41 [Symbiodinium natans]|uniref:Sna41 protein n=1 Tax=Symbiodinium natans TaxID=878477 RepID=A0A812QY46_9DINO|nr:sna41 [Symbiodinium natans]
MVLRNVREDNGRAFLEMLEQLNKTKCAASGNVMVHILAAADHDGVCASKMLVNFLEGQVKHHLSPVWENADIVEAFRQFETDTEVQAVVLLNCGASMDLEKLSVESKVPATFRCFVIDAHRPIAQENLSKRNERIIILDDDPIAEAREQRPPVDELDDDDESDVESEEDKENTDSAQNQSSLESSLESNRKRASREEKEDRRRRKRQRIHEYFMTSYHAMPASMSMFHMVRQVQEPSQAKNALWLAAVGLVGYLELGLMSEHLYNKLVWEDLKEALDCLNDSFNCTSSAGSTLPDSMQSDDEDSFRPRPRPKAKELKLRFDSDLRLTLYKHWTIMSSVQHSPYFYGTLCLHRDAGIRALKLLLAIIGVVPSEYKQLYRHLDLGRQRALRRGLTEQGKAYGLTETRMLLDQFVQELPKLSKECPISEEASSSDSVHLIQGILCAAGNEIPEASNLKLPDGKPDLEAIQRARKEARMRAFYDAWDVAFCDDPAAVTQGITRGQEVAKAVQTLARQIHDTRGCIKEVRRFRWTRIDQPPTVFRHPLAARKLAVWLSQTIYAYTQRPYERPLLVVIRDAPTDSYLCVGITPPSVSDVDEFGVLFRKAYRAVQSARISHLVHGLLHDWFDVDEMADVVKASGFSITLRENIARYFGVPVAEQAIYDEDGLIATAADLSRALQRYAPKLYVYNVNEIGTQLREKTSEQLQLIDREVERTRRSFHGRQVFVETPVDRPDSRPLALGAQELRSVVRPSQDPAPTREPPAVVAQVARTPGSLASSVPSRERLVQRLGEALADAEEVEIPTRQTTPSGAVDASRITTAAHFMSEEIPLALPAQPAAPPLAASGSNTTLAGGAESDITEIETWSIGDYRRVHFPASIEAGLAQPAATVASQEKLRVSASPCVHKTVAVPLTSITSGGVSISASSASTGLSSRTSLARAAAPRVLEPAPTTAPAQGPLQFVGQCQVQLPSSAAQGEAQPPPLPRVEARVEPIPLGPRVEARVSGEEDHCPACGTIFLPDSAFCRHCGRKRYQEGSQLTPRVSRAQAQVATMTRNCSEGPRSLSPPMRPLSAPRGAASRETLPWTPSPAAHGCPSFVFQPSVPSSPPPMASQPVTPGRPSILRAVSPPVRPLQPLPLNSPAIRRSASGPKSKGDTVYVAQNSCRNATVRTSGVVQAGPPHLGPLTCGV